MKKNKEKGREREKATSGYHGTEPDASHRDSTGRRRWLEEAMAIQRKWIHSLKRESIWIFLQRWNKLNVQWGIYTREAQSPGFLHQNILLNMSGRIHAVFTEKRGKETFLNWPYVSSITRKATPSTARKHRATPFRNLHAEIRIKTSGNGTQQQGKKRTQERQYGVLPEHKVVQSRQSVTVYCIKI